MLGRVGADQPRRAHRCAPRVHSNLDTSFDPADFEDPSPPAISAPDPFDPESLRLDENADELIGVQRPLLTVPVRKPSREWFIRTHPDIAYRLHTRLCELREGGSEIYLVAPALWSELIEEPTIAERSALESETERYSAEREENRRIPIERR
jgi:hypothetical protein